MRRTSARAAWQIVMLSLAGTLFAGTAQAQAGPVSVDMAITARVRGAFAKDRELASRDITVQTQGAVVSLRGFVRSVEDIARADALVRGVHGVSGIKNELRVANQPSRA